MKTNNILNLLRTFRLTSGRSFITSLLVAFVFSIFFCSSPGMLSMVYFTIMVFSALVIFSSLGRPSQSIHYLSMPASNFEKLFVNFLLVNVFYVVSYYLVMGVGAFVGQFAVMVLADAMDFSELTWTSVYFNSNLLTSFCALYASIAIAFFLSVMFKGKMGRELLLFACVFICFFILVAATIFLNVRLLTPAGYHYYELDWNLGPNFPEINENLAIILNTVLIMGYCYVLSFLRLRETEA